MHKKEVKDLGEGELAEEPQKAKIVLNAANLGSMSSQPQGQNKGCCWFHTLYLCQSVIHFDKSILCLRKKAYYIKIKNFIIN